MDWEECCKKMIVKSVKPDTGMINSLIKSSENRIKSQDTLTMNETTAGSKLSLAYDSLRELLEALALKNDYKIYNHECYSAFLKEIMDKSDKGDEFNEIRKIRNAVNYYGKDIKEKDADKIIVKIKNFRTFVLNLLESNNEQV